MGAWGVSAFENDYALDWVWELEESQDAGVLLTALRAVVGAGEGEYLDNSVCTCAVAAAEVVAAVRGHGKADLPEEVTEWIETHPLVETDRLVELAIQAMERVTHDSEFKELWEEAAEADAEAWKQEMADLRKRLLAN